METLLRRFGVLKNPDGSSIELGKGEWGSTYKAFHTELCCYIALKLLPRSLFDDDQRRQSFLFEARVAGEIRDQNIALVLPIAAEEEAFVYATEFTDEKTIEAVVASSGPMKPAPALEIALGIAAALSAVGNAGLAHHHLTPSNVLIVQDDEEVSVKLLDLGLPAHPQRGSVRYAEFFEAQGAPPANSDIRSNIYSVGAMLCFLLAGPTLHISLIEEMVRVAKHGSSSDPRYSNPLAELLLKALHPEPSARFQSPSELSDALQGLLESPRLVMIPPPVVEEVKPPPVPDIPQPAQSSEDEESAVVSISDGQTQIGDSRIEVLEIPAHLLGAGEPGAILRLVPQSEGSGILPILFISRPVFRIGRSQKLGADLLARYLPRNPKNDKKTQLLSKIHVVAKIEGSKILLFDGDGSKASLNGSIYDQQALSSSQPFPLEEPGPLMLDQDYVIDVIPAPSVDEEELDIANIGKWNGPPATQEYTLTGAVVFIPRKPNDIGIIVWIFTSACFETSRPGAAKMHEETVFHRYRGCFWIEARTATVTVDAVPLRRGKIAPISSGQIISIAGNQYRAAVEQ